MCKAHCSWCGILFERKGHDEHKTHFCCHEHCKLFFAYMKKKNRPNVLKDVVSCMGIVSRNAIIGMYRMFANGNLAISHKHFIFARGEEIASIGTKGGIKYMWVGKEERKGFIPYVILEYLKKNENKPRVSTSLCEHAFEVYYDLHEGEMPTVWNWVKEGWRPFVEDILEVYGSFDKFILENRANTSQEVKIEVAL